MGRNSATKIRKRTLRQVGTRRVEPVEWVPLPSDIDLTIVRFARLSPHGRPERCGMPSEDRQVRGVTKSDTRSKVVFDTVEDAEAAAEALFHITHDPLYPYLCKRTGDGHFHLSSRPGAQ
jgi:hypothetical protein